MRERIEQYLSSKNPDRNKLGKIHGLNSGIMQCSSVPYYLKWTLPANSDKYVLMLVESKDIGGYTTIIDEEDFFTYLDLMMDMQDILRKKADILFIFDNKDEFCKYKRNKKIKHILS